RWGAFLDSTLDRVVDAAVLISIAAYFLTTTPVQTSATVATAIALVMGQMTSYIRAKAESLGVQCKVGLAERAERTFVVWISLLISGLGWFCLTGAMYLLAVITTFTVIQRVVHVRKQLNS
ncbi:MAG: CDP-alcohol phosphatidyltransferase family protein, partial [Actinobacteria bacterium]|nr:CDP-alcohol phosphatidyltransferase family protein [Actinomycetota bacterium]